MVNTIDSKSIAFLGLEVQFLFKAILIQNLELPGIGIEPIT